MADNSKIEWTDASWNPIRARLLSNPAKVGWHCEHKSPGCENCYSERFNEKRLGTGLPFKPGHRKDVEIFLDDKMLTQPLRWKRPRKIFPCSMTDAFGQFVTDEMLDRMFAIAALTPPHSYQFLTKRGDRMRAYMNDPNTPRRVWRAMYGEAKTVAAGYVLDSWYGGPTPSQWPLPNVWLGVSVERQQEADERIPKLLATPAAVRFLSCEPLLGPVDWIKVCARWQDSTTNAERAHIGWGAPLINWVIVGGESGKHARPMQEEWGTALVEQCAAAGVACFVKQLGSALHGKAHQDFDAFPDALKVREFPHG